jgi:hypothetical protein
MGHLNCGDIADSQKFLRKVFREQLAEAERGRRRLVAAGVMLVQTPTVLRASPKPCVSFPEHLLGSA